MSMKKNEWLQQFGGCTTLENTPANLVELLTEYYRDPLVIFLWSEFDRVCDQDDCFAGTRWTEIMTGVHLNASRFYRREEPYIGIWALVCGDVVGPHCRNFYLCECCGYEWIDDYPGSPDDDCDRCGCRRCPPRRTEELDADGKVVNVSESRPYDQPTG